MYLNRLFIFCQHVRMEVHPLDAASSLTGNVIHTSRVMAHSHHCILPLVYSNMHPDQGSGTLGRAENRIFQATTRRVAQRMQGLRFGILVQMHVSPFVRRVVRTTKTIKHKSLVLRDV